MHSLRKYNSTFLRLSTLIVLAALLAGCAYPVTPAQSPQPAETSGPVSLTVIYTNDEHGWIVGAEPGSGAAEMAGLWHEKEGVGGATPVLVLSGGDNWTGPAISTWFNGESTVDVMNAMGYDAAALGNHEFDFGVEALKQRTSQAKYPYLSANLRRKSDGKVPEGLGIKAYTIVERGVLRIAIIGLTSQLAATTTNPANIKDFEFIDYETALREVVPQAKAEAPDLILAATHICSDELIPLAEKVADLGIDLMGAGHCHEVISDRIGKTVILGGGTRFESYAYASLTIDKTAAEPLINVNYGVRRNAGGEPDKAVAAVIETWQSRTNGELNEEIGYLDKEIPRNSKVMQALVLRSWLWAYPQADVAITNTGGFRDKIPAGPVTLAEIISVLPFDNVLIEIELTGKQLKKLSISGLSQAVMAGVKLENGHWILEKTGMELNDEAQYQVLVTDFLYAGGDDFTMLAQFDPSPYMTDISWRQPVIDWIRAQNSSADNPLNEVVQMLLQPE
jgi:2',3'-cyclic-nucleotide 2'-phosphodiesterase (5'-nucleotidase family)